MMHSFRIPLLALLLVLASNSGFSQTAQWDTTSLPRRYGYMLALDLQGKVYAIADSVLYSSSDDGTTWATLGIFRRYAQSLTIGPAGTVFITNDALGVFRSTDDGAHWSNSLVTEGCASLAVHPQGYVFAGLTYTGNGKVHRSTNGGDTWTGVQLPNASNSFATGCFGFGNNNEVYAGTIDGFYRSTDFGVLWTQFNSGLLGRNVRVMAVAPGQTIFMLTTYAASMDGLYKSTDRGESWQRIGSSPYFSSLVGSTNGDLFGTDDYVVYRSSDNGLTWANISTELGTSPHVISTVITPSGRLLVGGKYVYRKKEALTGIEGPATRPTVFSLEQNYPNPFNPATNIRFVVGAYCYTSLRVFDILGREIATLLNEVKPPGEYSVPWNGDEFPSGLYLYRLQAGNFVQTRKMILLR